MYMAPGYRPLVTDLTTLLDPYPPKNGPKRSFFGQNSVVDPNSKQFLKNLKYFLGSELIFEKKGAKKGQKGVEIGVLTVLPYFTLFHPIFLILPYFGQHLGVRRLNLGLRAKPRGLKATRRWDGD